jgi:hypothetical protein
MNMLDSVSYNRLTKTDFGKNRLTPAYHGVPVINSKPEAFNWLQELVRGETSSPISTKFEGAANNARYRGAAPYFSTNMGWADLYAQGKNLQAGGLKETGPTLETFIAPGAKEIDQSAFFSMLKNSYPELKGVPNNILRSKMSELAAEFGYDILRTDHSRGFLTALNKGSLLVNKERLPRNPNNIPGLRSGGTINNDNTLANLHQGEMVLTQPLTQKLNDGINALSYMLASPNNSMSSVSSGQPAQQVASAPVSYYNLTVQPSPGMDEDALANRVVRKLKDHERRVGMARR